MSRWWPLTLRGTGALILALACFVLAGELGTVELLYVGSLLLALIVASIVVLHLGRRIDDAERTLHPEMVPVGESTEVRVRITMRGMLPAGGARWSDALPRGLRSPARGDIDAFDTSSGPGSRTATVRYTATALCRGTWPLGPLSVRTSDPFGIAARTHRVAGDTRVIVPPAATALDHVPISAGESGGTLHAASDELGQGADNLIARPYAPGDSMRRIHWRATAHRDTLMVRQEEQEQTPTATVMLDRSAVRWDASARHSPGADSGFEAALSACVSIVLRLARDGYLVHVRDSDGQALCDPIPGTESADETDHMLTRFATITTRRDDTLPAVARLFAGDQVGPLLLITGRLDAADAAALAPAAHHSALPALLCTAASADAFATAGASGWHTAAIGPDLDLQSVWVGVAEHGGRRVHA
ncbi:MAG: DUF58 domain-containing protein [Microbacterium sp.]|uniref:DUF58 domain-containing protein n=1 Tax=Microbacterium sp. TaxID=51671 RepID=UPI000DB2AEDE|nr:DUF58 domain-containing protein [Microbacterium sp.]PZU39950.1 MAG: DUF58 domain-containing protein [Microbacterium sp.]